MTQTIQNILAGMGTVMSLFPSVSRIRKISYLKNKDRLSIDDAIRGDWIKIGQDFHGVIKREKRYSGSDQ